MYVEMESAVKVKHSKFRTKGSNTRYTRQLFAETQNRLVLEKKVIDPLYSLYYDYEGLVNFRKEYVRLGDPTGYKLAELYLEDYDHWQQLMKASWFVEAKAVWDIELDAKLKADAMQEIKKLVSDEEVAPAVRLSAAKFMATGGHRAKPEPKAKRGRPSKEEVEGELKREAELDRDFADDLKRIKLVKG